MVDVEARHLIPAGFIVLIAWVITIYLAKKLHKLITGKSDRSDKPRWFAANAAGVVFVLLGMVWSPRIIGTLSRYLGGLQNDPTEVIGLIFGMLFYSFIAAAVGFGIGKVRSNNKLPD